MPSASDSTALGWSAVGVNAESSLKGGTRTSLGAGAADAGVLLCDRIDPAVLLLWTAENLTAGPNSRDVRARGAGEPPGSGRGCPARGANDRASDLARRVRASPSAHLVGANTKGRHGFNPPRSRRPASLGGFAPPLAGAPQRRADVPPPERRARRRRAGG